MSTFSSDASSSKHILLIGRTNWVFIVFTITVRTNPSLPAFTSCILPRGQEPLGIVSSVTRTISSFLKLRHSLFHFCLICRFGIYSFNHLFQNTSAKYWICRHLLLEYVSAFLNIPGGKREFGRCSRMWLVSTHPHHYYLLKALSVVVR